MLKLSRHDVWMIRELYGNGEWTQDQLGCKFDVSASTISRVLGQKSPYTLENFPLLPEDGPIDEKLSNAPEEPFPGASSEDYQESLLSSAATFFAFVVLVAMAGALFGLTRGS